MKQTEVIEQLGGTKAVAALCGVTLGAVSQWKRSGIPEARLMYLKLARPDVDWAIMRGTVAVDTAEPAKTEAPKEAA